MINIIFPTNRLKTSIVYRMSGQWLREDARYWKKEINWKLCFGNHQTCSLRISSIFYVHIHLDKLHLDVCLILDFPLVTLIETRTKYVMITCIMIHAVKTIWRKMKFLDSFKHFKTITRTNYLSKHWLFKCSIWTTKLSQTAILFKKYHFHIFVYIYSSS
jgi:hypothetical protein